MSTKKIVPALAVEQEENKDLKIVRGDSNNFQSMVSEIETEKKLLDKWRKIDDAEKKTVVISSLWLLNLKWLQSLLLIKQMIIV